MGLLYTNLSCWDGATVVRHCFCIRYVATSSLFLRRQAYIIADYIAQYGAGGLSGAVVIDCTIGPLSYIGM